MVVGFFPNPPCCNFDSFLLIKFCMQELISFFSLALAAVLFSPSSSSSACNVSTCKDNADMYAIKEKYKLHF